MWFQQNWAAAHFVRQVRKHLTSTYNVHWIGQGGTMAWPPRPPDLTPHKSPDLHITSWFWRRFYCPTVEAVAAIKQQPGIFKHTHQSVVGCVSSSVAIRLNIRSFWKEIHLCFKIFQWFAWFPTSVRHNLMVHSTARTNLRYEVPWH
jgi:hypothetical protein